MMAITYWYVVIIINIYVLTDENECVTGNNNCSVAATCTNTQGSHICTCITGLSGDGFECSSKLYLFRSLLYPIIFKTLYEV